MKVYPISSCYVQNNSNKKPCFKGEFIQTNALNELMKYSNPSELIRFKELLEQIKKVPDNVFFWVNKYFTECETQGPDMDIITTYRLYKQAGNDTKTRKWVWSIYDDELNEMNRKIEELYKEQITLESKENLINKINGILLHNEPFDLKVENDIE